MPARSSPETRGCFLHACTSSVFAFQQGQRTTLILSIPELRAAMLDELVPGMHLLTEMMAERTGRRSDGLAVRKLAGAVVGAAMAVMFAISDDTTADLAALLDQALAHVDAGLDPQERPRP